ncbi:MAG TPA: hypothetical protein VKE91_07735 [Blastocatellia bacterium]|nr:hypothetical protein [Blastocatellia bacterium]
MREAKVSEAEMETIASSPFPYTRLRERIAAEQERRAIVGETWIGMLIVARRAIPAMLVFAVAMIGLFLVTVHRAPQAGSLSHDEVLASILNWDEQGVTR